MRILDLRCTACDNLWENYFQTHSSDPFPRCGVRVLKAVISLAHPEIMEAGIGILRACGGRMERVYLPTKRDNVIDDTIPGGMLIYNGLCHSDGTPKRFYSKTDIAKAALEKGLTNVVRHIPKSGTDKSPHTVRWDIVPPVDEKERLAHLHSTEPELYAIQEQVLAEQRQRKGKR